LLSVVDNENGQSLISCDWDEALGGFSIALDDGQQLEYDCDLVKDHTGFLINSVRIQGSERYRYTYRNHPFLNRKLLTSIDHSDGDFCINEYYDSKKNHIGDRTVIIDDPVRDHRIGKVKLQMAPAGVDDTPIVMARYFYENGSTEVLDASDRKTVYRHHPDGFLTAIEEYDGAKLYRKSRFIWNNISVEKREWQLKAKVWEDGKGNAVMAETFDYDSYGNRVRQTLYGNLSGKNSRPLILNSKGMPVDNGVESYSMRWIYDAANPSLLLSESEDNGKHIFYSYDDEGKRKTAEFIGDGTRILQRCFFEHDRSGKVSKIIVDDGSTKNSENVVGVTERHVTEFEYNSRYKQPSVIEKFCIDMRSGQSLLESKEILSYDLSGKVVSKEIFGPNGSLEDLLSYAYDYFGRVIRESNKEGNGWEKEYDVRGNVIIERVFDKGQLLGETDTLYDRVGRAIRIDTIDSKGKISTKTIRYNVSGEKIDVTDDLGNTTEYQYDGIGRVSKALFPIVITENEETASPVENYSYDIFNNRTGYVDANGGITTSAYTIRSKLCEQVYPDGSRETFVYNMDGTLQMMTDRKGVTTRYERDILGRETVVVLTDAEGKVRSFIISTYSPFHLSKTVRDGRMVTSYFYDGQGRISSKDQSFPEGQQHVEYHYGTDGKLISQKEFWGDTLTTEYFYSLEGELFQTTLTDTSGQILKKETSLPVSDPSNSDEEGVTRNSRGQLVRYTFKTDVHGNTTITTYDALDRIESVITKNSFGKQLKHLEVRYDLVGNKVKELSFDEGSLVRTNRWSYDSCNRVQTWVENADSSLARETAYLYNKEGLLESILRPDGTTIHHKYTASGQIEERRSSDGTFNYRYTYDVSGNAIKIVDLVSQTVTFRKFDSFGRLIEECLGNGLKISNTIDSIGRRLRLTLHDGSSIAYEYDPLYLRSISRIDQLGQCRYSHIYSKYSLNGEILETRLAGAAGNLTFNYDEKHRCRSIKGDVWSQEIPEEGMDSSGEIVELRGNDGVGDWTATFDYDDWDRLVLEKGDFSNTYGYDFRSNRIKKNEISYTIDGLDQLNHEYDLNGNMISRRNAIYHYDALDRLTGVEISKNIKVVFSYDSFNRRLSKDVSTWDANAQQWRRLSRQLFLYDGEKEIGVADEKGNLVTLRILGTGIMGMGHSSEIGAAVAHEIDSTVYVPVHDHRGNVCCLIDAASGAAAEYYRYSAFGETAIYSALGEAITESAIGNPWMFSSKRFDPETGFVFYGKRYYDPEFGRWLTKDPLGSFDGPNPYAFLHNNPLSSIDSFGLFSWSSVWSSTKNIASSFASYMNDLKRRLSYTEHMRGEWDYLAHEMFSHGFLQFAGYYQHSMDVGKTPFGREINDKVRITLINGILNARGDLEQSLDLFSSTHGNNVIHYIFHPTEGWSRDIMKAVLSKCGYVSPEARQLANKWKEMIEEMGGIDGGGVVLHYAHSIGATETNIARTLLTPEEQRLIHVITLGSPSMISNDSGFGSVVNYVSKRDGVSLLDPIGYLKGLFTDEYNLQFKGSFWGIPLIDHTLFTDTYVGVIRDLGNEFVDHYGR
ncbi:MAG: RHS repeat-associated core domain-containing protein, partial [Parachlamydiaceae bacterium]